MDTNRPQKDIKELDTARIMQLLPHRYPFLLIDKVVDIVAGKSAVGIKNVTINEPFFPGHFPGHPVMPGVLIVEAMAQTAAAMVVVSMQGDTEGKLVYFMAIDNARFRKPVVPGDVLNIQVTKKQQRGSVWKFEGIALVDDAVVAEAKFTAMIVDP
jgi:3-hydroxyacyl-[acyl-carrier-protein] dehydratase